MSLLASSDSNASLRLVPSQASATKKKSTASTPGMSRGRRGMFLRIPPDLYKKLRRMTATQISAGERGTIQGTVIALIERAKEKRP